MKLVKFPFLDQPEGCPIEVDIEKDGTLFEEGDETAGAYYVLSGVMELCRLSENENFISGFASTENTQLSFGSVVWRSAVLRKQNGQRVGFSYSCNLF
jgi:CRP-like cAMP-binding protein